MTGRHLVRAGFGSLLVRFSSLFLMMLSSIVLARALGASEFGTYSYVLGTLSLIGVPVQMGLPTLVLRETAAASARKEWARIRCLWSWATRRVFISIAFVTLIAAAIWPFLPNGRWHSTLQVLLVGLPIVPLVALGLLRSAALRGLHHLVLGQLPEAVVRPVLTIVLVGGVSLLLGHRISALGAVALSSLAALFSFCSGAAILALCCPAPIRDAAAVRADRAWKKAIWPLAAVSGVQVANQNFSILLLGFWEPAQIVGLLKIAQSGCAIAITGLTIAANLVVPRIASLYASNDRVQLQRLVSQTALASLLLFIPPFCIIAVWGRQLIEALYGSEYTSSYVLLLILLAGQAVNAFYGTVVNLLIMAGHEHATLRGTTAGAIFGALFALVLIPRVGAVGAAIASSMSMAVWNIWLWYEGRRLTGIDSSAFGLIAAERRTGHN